jgi:hypothetical protein
MLFGNHIEKLDKTAAKLRGGRTSDHEIEVVPTPRVGAEAPGRGVAVIPATRAGSTV